MASFQHIYEILKKDIDTYEGTIKRGRWSRSMGINWALFTLLLDGALKRKKVRSKSGLSDLPQDADLTDAGTRKQVVVEIASMLECYLRNLDANHEYSVAIVMKEKNKGVE